MSRSPPSTTTHWCPEVCPGVVITDMPGVAGVEPMADGWVRISMSRSEAVSAVLQIIVTAGITALRVERPSLEDVYLELIGERGMAV